MGEWDLHAHSHRAQPASLRLAPRPGDLSRSTGSPVDSAGSGSLWQKKTGSGPSLIGSLFRPGGPEEIRPGPPASKSWGSVCAERSGPASAYKQLLTSRLRGPGSVLAQDCGVSPAGCLWGAPSHPLRPWSYGHPRSNLQTLTCGFKSSRKTRHLGYLTLSKA